MYMLYNIASANPYHSSYNNNNPSPNPKPSDDATK